MSKRFFDTEIWKKEWFCELDSKEQLAWFYILMTCDNVGVWSPNIKLAEFLTKSKIDWKEFPKKLNGNIEILENGKWFISDFCNFQYGDLKETCTPHRSYLALLKKHNLTGRVRKGLVKGMETLQDKDKEKDKDLDMDMDKDKEKDKETDAAIRRLKDRYGIGGCK